MNTGGTPRSFSAEFNEMIIYVFFKNKTTIRNLLWIHCNCMRQPRVWWSLQPVCLQKTDESSYFLCVFFCHCDILQISGIIYHCLILPVRKLLIIWKLLYIVIVKLEKFGIQRRAPRENNVNDTPQLKNYRCEHNGYYMMLKVFNLKRSRIRITHYFNLC